LLWRVRGIRNKQGKEKRIGQFKKTRTKATLLKTVREEEKVIKGAGHGKGFGETISRLWNEKYYRGTGIS